MNSMARWLLPEGISDVLPGEARLLEQLRRAALDLFRAYGYEQVVPPLAEYVESLLTGVGADLDLRTFKLVAQLSGRMLGLRADITPQVARIDAHILNRAGVVRLCYAASVLHARPLHPLATRQPFYVGAELFGHGTVAADAEVLDLAARTLGLAEVGAVRFDLGHTRVLRALLEIDPAAQAHAEDIVAALSAKDAATLAALTAALAAPARAALRDLIRLHGDERVLGAALDVLPARPAIAAALDELRALVEVLDADDHLGLRDHLGAVLLRRGDAAGALALAERFPDDFVGMRLLHARALLELRRETDAQEVFASALKANPHLLVLLRSRRAPRLPAVDAYRVGSREQARVVVAEQHDLWRGKPLQAWLKSQDPGPGDAPGPVQLTLT